MALTKAQKNAKVAALAADLENSTSAIIGTFTGLTASKDFALRKTVREAGGSYHVVKNKLAAKSSQGTKVEKALQGLKGVSAVAYTSGDPVALAKALSDWVKDNAEFTFKLGIVDGKVITREEIGALANMPGKEELFSKLLFLINAPAQRLVTVTNAVGRNLAVVVNQAVEQGKLPASGGTTSSASAQESAPAAETPAAETPAAETPSAVVPATPEAASAPVTPEAATEAAAEDKVAEAHAVESPTRSEEPTAVEQIAANPASEADPVGNSDEQPSGAAQPENSTASQGGEAASTDAVEG